MVWIVKTSDRELVAEGLYPGVVCDVVDRGLIKQIFDDVETTNHIIEYKFQLDEKDSKGRRFVVGRRFNLTFGKNGHLVKEFLLPLYGKNLKVGPGIDFDLESPLGESCQVVVTHRITDQATFANAGLVSPMGKGQAPLAVEGYVREKDRTDALKEAIGF